MPYEEKPPSRKQRVAWLVGLWVIFAGPMVVLFFFWGGWFGLIPLAVALWASYDYLRSGAMASQLEAVELTTGEQETQIRRFF